MRILAIIVGAVAIAAAFFFGESYIPRLPNHAGYWQVSVDDEVHVPPPPRPRHLVVVVVDGLKMPSALPMKSVATVRAHGQCRTMDVGKLTISRPVYTILSTGLEADRTGSRNNDQKTPLAAQSIWEVAKNHGLEVTGASHNLFWQQLFPNGFSRYKRTEEEKADIFAGAPIGDLALFHPDYVDEAGHAFGGASPEYAALAARADVEIGELLARLDLEQDVLVITADHGHVDYGGHGGEEPVVEQVLTCFGGPGIKHRDGEAPLDARSVAPALALRLGVPFPKNMRAGEDDLDTIFDIVDVDAAPAYAADRHAAITHFREANEAALTGWLGGPPGTWSRLYARERQLREQKMWAGLALIPIAVVLWRRKDLRSAAFLLSWMLAYYTLGIVLHVLVRGTFDFTAVSSRGSYVPACIAIGVGTGLVASGIHAVLFRDRDLLLRDQVALVLVTLWLNVLHPLAWGWPLGFPIPNRHLLVFPFFGAFLLLTSGGITILLALASLYSRRRAARGPQLRASNH